MPVTLEEVQSVIREEFPGSVVDGIHEENHRVVGEIVWEGFKGQEFDERNRLVTKKVRNRLGFKGINVGVLFPLAPGEHL